MPLFKKKDKKPVKKIEDYTEVKEYSEDDSGQEEESEPEENEEESEEEEVEESEVEKRMPKSAKRKTRLQIVAQVPTAPVRQMIDKQTGELVLFKTVEEYLTERANDIVE
jgi:hypothetical protein